MITKLFCSILQLPIALYIMFDLWTDISSCLIHNGVVVGWCRCLLSYDNFQHNCSLPQWMVSALHR